MKLLLIILCFITSGAVVQDSNVWETLSKLRWESINDPAMGMEVQKPIFGDEIKALDGEEVELEGYILPVEVEGDLVVLSSLPYASCFFCGGAGPETVMQVDIKKKISIVDKKVRVRGMLKLNDQDFFSLIYSLEKAKLIEVID
ncbi:hypothetical protein R9C00_22020 [Flammeovirgaceae bacterium SG7u.111]|nr:hypothetical protein [Flammeovirgaceae bacterium SG7u.132]WPO34381.1 hypothetical protein R9C00_22020 [Flammeovirgaceae bacterium SG7u.111]